MTATVAASATAAALDSSTAHLVAHLAGLERRVAAAVAARRQTDPAPDDPFRGLYLADHHVERLLEGPQRLPAPASDPAVEEAESAADAAEAAGEVVRLRRLARVLGLDPVDVELLLVAMAPDLDSRFEKLYGYLHDDVTRRRASIGLALELVGAPPIDPSLRNRFDRHGPLLARGLVEVEEPERPFLTRSLRVPDRVTAHLLGDDRPEQQLVPLLWPFQAVELEESATLAAAVRAGAQLIYLRDRTGAAPRAAAASALASVGLGVVMLDLDRVEGDVHAATALAAVAGREALLQGSAVIAGPIEALESKGIAAVRAFAELPCVTFLFGRRGWDATWSRSVALTMDAPVPPRSVREQLWETGLGGNDANPPAVTIAVGYRLNPDEIARAAAAARLDAAARGLDLDLESVRRGARSQNASGLDRLARRIEARVSWDDLVLPPATHSHLRELAARARNRERVLEDWQMRPGGGRGRGVTALFAGDSGTGKTMSAEVIAGELGLDLYAVDLATVVDKYVGETEKNLERIFSEADGVNGVILFDEADALFGKRSEVSDANDRYANVEVAYLLQRMESFDGIAILSTNLKANLDEAFARRLDVIVDFPSPDPAQRLQLWERCLGTLVPRADDVDLEFFARSFEFSGGNIRSVATTAAYLAAEQGRPVSMADLVHATSREYRKLGRLVVESEFGEWFRLVRTAS